MDLGQIPPYSQVSSSTCLPGAVLTSLHAAGMLLYVCPTAATVQLLSWGGHCQSVCAPQAPISQTGELSAV